MSGNVACARVRSQSSTFSPLETRDGDEQESSSSDSQHGSSKRGPQRRATDLPSAADLYVPSLPGLPEMATHPTHPLNIYAGMLPSYPGEGKVGGEGQTGKDAKLYFLMAKARRNAGKERVIFWFNGGPGCSSFDGSLMEVGPFRTVPATETTSGMVEAKLVEGGWEEFATVVFVDQPPGTGYSYAATDGYLHDFDELSAHFIEFLQNFYTVFPELKGVDTYLAGESFAGQYIPFFADALIKSIELPNFPLKGIAIGNGWIDPKEQYPGYVEFAYEKGLIVSGTPEAEEMESALKRCQEEMDKYSDPFTTPVNINNCGQVMDSVTRPFTQELNGKKVCMNVYDVRLVDDFPACGMNWPPDLPDVYTFLRQDDVISALHATSKETAWVECNNKVSYELNLKKSHMSAALLPSILEAGVPILMFAGAEDLICNYKGIERIVNGLEWDGEKGFGNATSQEWYFNGTQVGTWQTSRGLSYAKIFDSSHMVGFDVPHVSNDMIMRFMDVDVSLLPGMTAQWPSRIGDDERTMIHVGDGESGGVPLIEGGNTDWEAWYNAIFAFLVLGILVSIAGLYFYFRRKPVSYRSRISLKQRSRRHRGHDMDEDEAAERMPLGSERLELDDIERAEGYEFHDGDGERYSREGKGKGKERAKDREEVVFALGDDDEDDHH
ncbi:KEX1 protein precursor, putative [Cryptococcus deneoformans JEC21]|uniref:Pheromone-processing carboxypeptidase KEX1 n=1 Tax=Cryptococcus deneoformans (strain JEC21 / ATCC MYA-565) TaxID=214684 RepID=Q5KHB0_CRYD1|nr:KEX1 protein precursor, putative [Cryptococcus neoformans var. neoformans JEC21]AAW43480.1 KEX1 protein precursor, putative [Cryptococcus neoformans var. neoformans JEC21]